MLSLANVSAAHGANYFKVENYYSKKDSLSYSRWAGKDAAQCGLVGAVEHSRFSQLLKGTDSQIQVAGQLKNRKRAGLDMTFSAPKSVSLQALVFGDNRLVEAHREAVSEALGYAEKHFAAYRSGRKNERVVCKGNGLLIAQFEHDSSRLKDPQLHTHNVVLNRIKNENGEVRALHGDLIFKNSVLLGMIYQNSLAQKVQELGYAIHPNSKGSFEIQGFSQEQLAVFSKRKAQIDSMSPENYRETRSLVLTGRQAKKGPQQRDSLIQQWEIEARKNQIQKAHFTMSKDCLNKVTKPAQVMQTVNQAVSSLSIKSAVFSQEQIVKESLFLALGKFTLPDLENAIQKHKESRLMQTRKADFFTTKESVEQDLKIRNVIEEGVGGEKPVLEINQVQLRLQNLKNLDTKTAVEAIQKTSHILFENGFVQEKIDDILIHVTESLQQSKQMPLAALIEVRKTISDSPTIKKMKNAHKKDLVNEAMNPLQKAFLAPTTGQLEAIEKTLLSKDKYIIWQGVAGAGKTYALRQIVEAVRQNGFEVKGFAPSAAAALLLSKETGIETDTVQAHILKRESPLNSKRLWIVDEAGMIAAKDFRDLQIKAEKHQARLLLVGDHRQLSPVDAGNPFRDVQRHTNTTLIHLNESLRQKDPLLQEVVAHMNQGDVIAGIHLLDAHIHALKTANGRSYHVAKEFLKKDSCAQENTILLARTNQTRDDLTQEIRNGLKKQGFLKNEIQLPVLRKIDVSSQRMHVSSTYSPGDVLVPNKHYQTLGLVKDQPYEILGANALKNTVWVGSGSKKIEIPVSKNAQFSLFSKGFLAVAEGDKMIWNRNLKSRGQLNNGGFVVEQVTRQGVRIRSPEGQVKIIDPKVPQHMEHAWALTLYKAQGQTASGVLQIVDAGTTKRDLLVGVTRAAHDVTLVAESKGAVLKCAEIDTPKPVAADEVLSQKLGGAVQIKSKGWSI